VCVCEVSASSSLQCSDNARRLEEQLACKHYTNLTLDKHKRIHPTVRGETANFRSGVRPKGPKPEAQKADSAGEVFGEREASPSPPRGFGEHCKLPQRGPEQSPGHKNGFLYFRGARRPLLELVASFLAP